MNRILKWILIVAGGLVGLLVVAYLTVWFVSTSRISKRFDVTVESIAMASDSAAIERGRHIVDAIVLCRDCHAEDLGGQVLADDPVFGFLGAPNITPAGLPAAYDDEDWVRLLRHGVKPDGRSAIVMPSESFRFLSDTDLAALIAYVRQVPAVDRAVDGFRAGPMARILIATGPLLSAAVARRILADTMPLPTETTPDSSVGYGYYLALSSGCMGCHGDNLTGGPMPAGPPDAVPAANITPGGIGSWTFGVFDRAMREGVGPADRAVDAGMPRRQAMTETEMRALWAYLRSLPARQYQSD